MRLQLIASCIVVLGVAWNPAGAAADGGDGWKISADTLIYSDNDNVRIISPQLAVHHPLDDDGGSVGARVVVDVVSAASVDVVSQATDRFSETRTEVDLSLAKAMGKWLPSFSYNYSHEPDYLSNGFGVGVQRRLGSADTTLRLGYNLSLDTVGYHGTSMMNFSESLTTHMLSASITQNASPTTVIRGIYTLSVQDGYMEKPYRFVPLFDQAGIDKAAMDGVSINLETFDQYRLPLRPAESVPDQRIGHAFAMRLMQYVKGLPGSLRLDYQFFADTWGVQAHMLQPGIYWKRSDRTTVSTYGRLYIQQAAGFWQRQYIVQPGQVPKYRTMDRDLSDYLTVTGGARIQWHKSPLTLYADGSAMYTHYDDYLFLTSRLALVLQLGLRLQL